MSKSQKKIIKKLNKFLENGELNDKEVSAEGSDIHCYETQPELFKRPEWFNILEPNIILKNVKVNKDEIIQEHETNILHGTGEPCSTKPIQTINNGEFECF